MPANNQLGRMTSAPIAEPQGSIPEALLERRDVPESYEPDTMYDVELFRSARYRGRMLAAGQAHQMIGSVAMTIADSILVAKPIRDPNAE